MRVDCTYTYHCDIAHCDETSTQHVEDEQAAQLPHPTVPEHWQQFGALLICPLHAIVLTVDGAAFTP